MSYVKYNFVCIGAIGLGNGFFDNRDVVARVSNVQCTGDDDGHFSSHVTIDIRTD